MNPVVPLSSLPVSPSSREFQGQAFGSGISFILVDCEPGHGPRLHRHPYSETFLVLEGNVRFTLGEEQVDASAGSVVVVPPDTPHRFENLGPGRLFQIDIHAADHFETEWL